LAKKEKKDYDAASENAPVDGGGDEEGEGGGEGKNRRFRAAAAMPAGALHVQLVFASSGSGKATYPRAVVLCGRGNALKLTQSYCALPAAGAAAADASAVVGGFTNGLTRLVCGVGSRVQHEYVQEASSSLKAGPFYDAVSVRVAKGADHAVVAFGLGGAFSRVNYDCAVAGENARTSLACVLLSDGRQSMDLHSSIVHAAPNSQSFQQHRNLVADRSECVFKGRIRVDQVAQGTNSNQLCKSLLLSDNARVTVMPSMEIVADQVPH
jgi:Fe-S cluster assembly protein SufD